MFYRYSYESEIYPDLSRVPLHVRMKLDLTGVKISLKGWLAFSLEERWALCHLPVETEEEKKNFSSYLDFLSRRYFGEKVALVPAVTDPPWEDPSCIPESVEGMSQKKGRPITLREWSRWNIHQRYALFKVSTSKNEPEEFYGLLSEFRKETSKPS
jgi:hypothetical protein